MKIWSLSHVMFVIAVTLSSSSYGDQKKEDVSNKLGSWQCPQITENSWNFGPYAKCHFDLPDQSMGGSERGCTSFVDENGKPISPTFHIDYAPGSIRPEIKGCDVNEDTKGHIVAKNCSSIDFSLCGNNSDKVDINITNPNNVHIIGVNCDAGVCGSRGK
ncbi:MAG: hypothetical protein LN569_02910 [Rickettsia endosymbiont of Labidopullus appendiculatus]|nr:hypothetical protein [Rickettsia endosymbiont of Labidopullus appendiculatus]